MKRPEHETDYSPTSIAEEWGSANLQLSNLRCSIPKCFYNKSG